MHLIHPLGFHWDDRRLRRAGLDYREWVTVQHHETLGACRTALRGSRLFAFSTRGPCFYSDATFLPGDAFLFGPETRGLPTSVLDEIAPSQVLRLPMVGDCRSLNLANTVAVVVYEAWRQHRFTGAEPLPRISRASAPG